MYEDDAKLKYLNNHKSIISGSDQTGIEVNAKQMHYYYYI